MVKNPEKETIVDQMIKEKKQVKEINAMLKKKFGRGVSNNFIKERRDLLLGNEISNLRVTQVELEEVKSLRQFETQRLRIVAVVLPGQQPIDVIVDLKQKLSEGFNVLRILEEKIGKFNSIKADLVNGKISTIDQDKAKERLADLYTEIKKLRNAFKEIGIEPGKGVKL